MVWLGLGLVRFGSVWFGSIAHSSRPHRSCTTPPRTPCRQTSSCSAQDWYRARDGRRLTEGAEIEKTCVEGASSPSSVALLRRVTRTPPGSGFRGWGEFEEPQEPHPFPRSPVNCLLIRVNRKDVTNHFRSQQLRSKHIVRQEKATAQKELCTRCCALFLVRWWARGTVNPTRASDVPSLLLRALWSVEDR